MRCSKAMVKVGLLVLGVGAGCSSTDDRGIAGPSDPMPIEEDPPNDPPSDPPPSSGGSDGSGGSAGSVASDGSAACGDEGSACCSGGICNAGLICGSEGSCQAPSEPSVCGEAGMACCSGQCTTGLVCTDGVCQTAPAPTPAPTECGLAGQACCTSGDACPGALGKAQCCTACTGSPEFTCQCSESLITGGSCKLCCVVCKDGHVKTAPIDVGAAITCQAAASDWCLANRGVVADANSGWKNSCG